MEAGGQEIGRIGPGLVVLLGVAREDSDADSRYLVDKISNLRIFADQENRFNRSALDVGAELLIVSQFTLFADTRKGRRPDFNGAALPKRPSASTITRLTGSERPDYRWPPGASRSTCKYTCRTMDR